jgi:dipicolinate synthase subunit A
MNKVSFIGGDRRQQIAASLMQDMGFSVTTYGVFPPNEEYSNGFIAPSLSAALHQSKYVVLPVPYRNKEGYIPCGSEVISPSWEEVYEGMERGSTLIMGLADPELYARCAKKDIRFRDFIEEGLYAEWNCIPTAEGALRILMQELPITIHESHMLVTGYGRITKRLAANLRDLGCYVSIAARNPAARKAARASGIMAYSIDELSHAVKGQDAILNTVPAMLFDPEIISHITPGTLLIELASAPGGFDRAAVAAAGLRIINAPGLPGKEAPVTSGQVLAKTFSNFIQEESYQ